MTTYPDFLSRNDFDALGSAEYAGLLRMPRGSNGQLVSANAQNSVKTLVNSNPEAKQVTTITVAGSPTASPFSVIVNGKTITYTADSSPTQTEVTAGLLAALQFDPFAGQAAVYSITSAGVITAIGRNPGYAFTITTSNADLTVATTTSAASADPINFGVAIIKLPGQYADGSELCAVASTANLTAQVDTLTVAYTGSKTYQVNITVDGTTYPVLVVSATDLATLTTLLVDQINAAMPSYTVLASSTGAGNVTLTAEVAGKAFITSIGAQTTPGNLTIEHTTSGPATDFFRCFAGVSLIADNVEGAYTTSSDSGATAYKPNSGVKCVYRAADGVYVDNAQVPTDSDKVYVELAPGSTAGKFFTTSGNTRLLFTNPNLARWKGDPDMADDGIGILVVGSY